MKKYIKPKSLTWWSALVPLVMGVVLATEPLHGWAGAVTVIQNLTGGATAAVLINAGLAGIGLRGAMG
ncbi:MAG: hypothetical protein CML68_13380 [Rhodobacteraceae bacterium]|nr:hypothetical protein [Paracoccaceae bacterium]